MKQRAARDPGGGSVHARHADFDLRDRMLVVGPNVSGKSNRLDGLRFLRQVASPGGSFQQAVRSRGGLVRVRCLAAWNHRGGRVTRAIRIGDDEQPDRWSHEVTFSFSRERRGQHRPVGFRERVRQDGERVLERTTGTGTRAFTRSTPMRAPFSPRGAATAKLAGAAPRRATIAAPFITQWPPERFASQRTSPASVATAALHRVRARRAVQRDQVTLLMWPPSTARTVPVM